MSGLQLTLDGGFAGPRDALRDLARERSDLREVSRLEDYLRFEMELGNCPPGIQGIFPAYSQPKLETFFWRTSPYGSPVQLGIKESFERQRWFPGWGAHIPDA